MAFRNHPVPAPFTGQAERGRLRWISPVLCTAKAAVFTVS